LSNHRWFAISAKDRKITSLSLGFGTGSDKAALSFLHATEISTKFDEIFDEPSAVESIELRNLPDQLRPFWILDLRFRITNRALEDGSSNGSARLAILVGIGF
jgi:hypothetical protein